MIGRSIYDTVFPGSMFFIGAALAVWAIVPLFGLARYAEVWIQLGDPYCVLAEQYIKQGREVSVEILAEPFEAFLGPDSPKVLDGRMVLKPPLLTVAEWRRMCSDPSWRREKEFVLSCVREYCETHRGIPRK